MRAMTRQLAVVLSIGGTGKPRTPVAPNLPVSDFTKVKRDVPDDHCTVSPKRRRCGQRISR